MKKTVLVVLALALIGIVISAGCVTAPEEQAASPVGIWFVPGQDVVLFICPDGTYFGYAQVNSFTGTYTIDGDKLTFAAPAATLMDGPGIEEETAFFQALSAVKSFAVNDGKLVLITGEETGLVLVQSFVGTWAGDHGFTLTFNPDQTFSGKGPVNSFFGTYANEADSLVISLGGITNAAGSQEDMAAEAAFLDALAAAKDYTIVGGKLTFLDAAFPETGNELLTLTAALVGSYTNQYGDTLVLNADGTFSGQAPVNAFMGTYEIADGKIILNDFSMTKMAGDGESTRNEASFLEKLEAENYTLVIDQFLTGYDKNGEVLHFFFHA